MNTNELVHTMHGQEVSREKQKECIALALDLGYKKEKIMRLKKIECLQDLCPSQWHELFQEVQNERKK